MLNSRRAESNAHDCCLKTLQAADDLTTERAAQASTDAARALAASQPPPPVIATGPASSRPAPPGGGRWVPQTPFAAVAEAGRSLDAEQQPQVAPPEQLQQPPPPGQRGSSTLRSASDVPPGELQMDVPSSVAQRSVATLSAANASEAPAAADESLRAVSAGSSGSAKSGGANPNALFALRPGPQPLARFSTGGGAATAERERRRRQRQQQQQQELPRQGSCGSIASGGGCGSSPEGSASAGVGSAGSSSLKGADSNPFVRISDASIAAGESPLRVGFSNRSGGLGSRDGSGIPRVMSLGSGGIAEALYADGPAIPEEAEAASSSFGGRRTIDAAELYLQSAATFAAAAEIAAKLQAGAAAEGDAAAAATGAVVDGGGPSAADATPAAALLEAAGRTKPRADFPLPARPPPGPRTGGGRRAGIGSIRARSAEDLSLRPIAANAQHGMPDAASPYAMFALPAAASADAEGPARCCS